MEQNGFCFCTTFIQFCSVKGRKRGSDGVLEGENYLDCFSIEPVVFPSRRQRWAGIGFEGRGGAGGWIIFALNAHNKGPAREGKICSGIKESSRLTGAILFPPNVISHRLPPPNYIQSLVVMVSLPSLTHQLHPLLATYSHGLSPHIYSYNSIQLIRLLFTPLFIPFFLVLHS